MKMMPILKFPLLLLLLKTLTSVLYIHSRDHKFTSGGLICLALNHIGGAGFRACHNVFCQHKDLTVGQMQGKFQMQVLPQVGHTVHEDSPEKVAELIASFLVRNKFCSALDNFSPVFPGC